ncbi:hypothetical protein ACI79C_03495 [Geodermatophilus sp. SYSU D00697]
MHARTTTIRGNPHAVDDGIAYLRDEVLPVIGETGGWVGLSMLADRESGRCIATTAWESEAAMRASDADLLPMRLRLAELLDGSLQVHYWQIAVVHRAHGAPDGAWTRTTWIRTDPAEVDRLVDAYKATLLPRLEAMDGFCSASLVVDRREGRAGGAVTFADRRTLDRSRADATAARDELAATAGAQLSDVGEYELVLAHLRVPETV